MGMDPSCCDLWQWTQQHGPLPPESELLLQEVTASQPINLAEELMNVDEAGNPTALSAANANDLVPANAGTGGDWQSGVSTPRDPPSA